MNGMFNDDFVNKIPESQIDNYKSKAYILYYTN